MMVKFFLTLTFFTSGSPSSTTIPQYYESLPACKQAGEVSMGEYKGDANVWVGYTCTPWNSEGD